MSNRNKRGLKNLNKRGKNKMSSTSGKDQSQASASIIRKTRSSECKSNVDNTKETNKKKNDFANSQQLIELKEDFYKQLADMKAEMKAKEDKNENDLSDQLNVETEKYQEMKQKNKDKKNIIAKLRMEIDQKIEVFESAKKNHEDSIALIKCEVEKKMAEIGDLQKNNVKLTDEVEKLKSDITNKEKEFSSLMELTKENHQKDIKNEKAKFEESTADSVSKQEYNNLVDDYEKLKIAYEEKEIKLNKAIAEKNSAQKGKLDIIKQKEQQKNMMLEFITTFNRDIKPLIENRYGNRSYAGSSTDKFPKRVRRF